MVKQRGADVSVIFYGLVAVEVEHRHLLIIYSECHSDLLPFHRIAIFLPETYLFLGGYIAFRTVYKYKARTL